MRRSAFICAFLALLAVPAAALALPQAAGDGILVIQNGTAPLGTPVVTLSIQGTVIGKLMSGRIVIQDETPFDPNAPEVTGYTSQVVKDDGQTRIWKIYPGVGGSDTSGLRFRAAGGTYKITIYGSGVNLVASGYQTFVLAGSPDPNASDGKYAVAGNDFRSLPTTPSAPRTIGILPSATG
jgi:hypothetical protein